MSFPRRPRWVYLLLDASGAPLYIGKSVDVKGRLRQHYADAKRVNNPSAQDLAKREWFFKVRSVSLIGPLTNDQANLRERQEIERFQPVGNRQFTEAHGWRPGNGNPFESVSA